MRSVELGEDSGSSRSARGADRRRSLRRRAVAGLIVVVGLALAIAFIVDLPGFDDPGPPPLTVVRVITGPGTGEAPDFVRPLAAAWGPDGTMVVSDTENARICVFAGDGRYLRDFGDAQTPSATDTITTKPLVMPVGLDVASDGSVYVADLRGARVAIYDRDGRFVRTFAPPDAREWRPTDVAVSERDVFVTDESGVDVFTRNGGWRWRLPVDGDTDALARPNGVAVGTDGQVYLSDTNRFRVVSTDASGTVRWATEGGDSSDRMFGLPRGLAVTTDGTVFVADAFGFSITELDRAGTFVRRWGAQGAQPGRFNYPNDVDVNGDLLLVTDKENHRVQVLRLRRDGRGR